MKTTEADKKNIILLITDTFRFDNLFDRARRPIRTPHLDVFARERAAEIVGFYTSSFPTIPHRTDLTTGRVGWPWYPWQPLDRSSRNAWPRMLREAGYATQLICDCPHLFNAGFQHTFMAAFQTRGQEGDCPLLHLNDPIRPTMPRSKSRQGAPLQPLAKILPDQHRWTNRYYQCEEETFCSRTSRLAVRWIEENYRFRPFFLWVDFFDPHEPWDPPEYLVRHYQKEYRGKPMLHPNYGRASDYSDDELTNLWAHYAAEAELVDRALGHILRKIDDLQLWDNSVVVVTSDHGFSIGEHARVGKCNINKRDPRRWPLYPEVSHVPFLLAASDIAGGRSHNILAQPPDILPTVSELAGVQVKMTEEVHGRSFANVLRGRSRSHRSLAVCAQFLKPDTGFLPPKATIPFVTDGHWGYTPVGPEQEQPQLFNLEKDPLAENNVAGRYPSEVRRLQKAFKDWLIENNVPDPIVRLLTTS